MKLLEYPAYGKSGVEFIGLIPSHWKTTALKRVIAPCRPITYGIVQAGDNIPDGIPYIRPVDMTDEKGLKDNSTIMRTAPEIAQAYTRSKLKRGDLVCSIGPSFGKLMLVPEWLDGANLTQGTARLAIDSGHTSKYFFWALRAVNSYAQWDSIIGGATFRALNLGPLAETIVPLPTKEEQSQIASFLDSETAKIDCLIEKQQRLIELLEEKRQAVISHAVTKGLNPDAPMKDSGVEWLGQVPEHWRVCSLRWEIKIQSGDAISNTQIEKVRDELNQFKVIGGNGVLGYTVEANSPKDSIAIGRVGALCGNIHFINDKCWITDNALKMSVSSSFINDYIVLLIQAARLNDYANKSAQPLITGEQVKALKVAIPDISEQRDIVTTANNKLAHIDLLIQKAEHSISLMLERRTALISAAVTGKIDVRDQVPQDVEEAVAS